MEQLLNYNLMKTIRTVITLIAFAIVAVSCQRSEMPTLATDNPAAIIATISNDATRATFTDNVGVGVALTWEVNDTILLYDTAGNYAAIFITSAGGGATATFTLSDGTPADGNYTAVYPAYYTAPGVPAPTLAHRAQVVNGLTQDGNNSTAHLDAQSYMSGTLAYSSGGFTSNAVSFDMEFALLTVDVATPTGYLAVDGVPTSFTLHNGGKTTALFLTNISTTDVLNGLTLYMVVDPYKNPTATPDEERTLHFELITENATYVKEKANVSKEYEAGKRYTAALTGTYALELATGVYTLATLQGTPSSAPTTWVVTDAITDATGLSALRTAIISSGKEIRLILPAATSIGNSMFNGCTRLASISLPKATSLGYNAFYGCTALSSIILPVVTSIGNSAFYGCTRLASISLPVATSIGSQAFYGCAISSISLPKAIYIRESAFWRCTALSSISLPAATNIENYAFYGCTRLASISLPVATSIGNQAFWQCTALSSISLPEATSIGNSAFSGCTALSSISLPEATSIGHSAFGNCPALTHLEIGGAITIANVGNYLFDGTTVVGNINLTVGAGETANVTDGNTKWRGYGPFASITVKP